ncbi:MAG: hypothetical protein QXX17_06645 [Conexivisphaerales archaeon]
MSVGKKEVKELEDKADEFLLRAKSALEEGQFNLCCFLYESKFSTLFEREDYSDFIIGEKKTF